MAGDFQPFPGSADGILFGVGHGGRPDVWIGSPNRTPVAEDPCIALFDCAAERIWGTRLDTGGERPEFPPDGNLASLVQVTGDNHCCPMPFAVVRKGLSMSRKQ